MQGGSAGTSGGSAGSSAGSSGSAGSAGTAGTSTTGGNGSGGGAGTSAGGEGGSGGETASVYGEPCDQEGDICSLPSTSCVELSFGGGAITGLTCSNECTDVSDCDPAPSGTEAVAACLPFTSADRCVLLCEFNGDQVDCPAGMQCVGNGGSDISICVWL